MCFVGFTDAITALGTLYWKLWDTDPLFVCEFHPSGKLCNVLCSCNNLEQPRGDFTVNLEK